MKTFFFNRIWLLMYFCLLLPAASANLKAQTVIRIGEAEISVASPLSISKRDSSKSDYYKMGRESDAVYPRYFQETFIGLGSVLPHNRSSYMDMHYGKINTLEFGTRYFYRLSNGYSIGTILQYTYYNYKLSGIADEGIIRDDVPGDVKKEYYRTDNIGTGLINRFYLFPIRKEPFVLDLGGYADFSFSKRYNVKTRENGKNEKYKYRDDSMFNPFNAGLYGAVKRGGCSVYIRYRLTNLFNPELLDMELPEVTLGVQFRL